MTEGEHRLQTGMTLKVHPQGCIHVYDAEGKEVHWHTGIEEFLRQLHPLFMGILHGTIVKVERDCIANGWPSLPETNKHEQEATQLARSPVADTKNVGEA